MVSSHARPGIRRGRDPKKQAEMPATRLVTFCSKSLSTSRLPSSRPPSFHTHGVTQLMISHVLLRVIVKIKACPPLSRSLARASLGSSTRGCLRRSLNENFFNSAREPGPLRQRAVTVSSLLRLPRSLRLPLSSATSLPAALSAWMHPQLRSTAFERPGAAKARPASSVPQPHHPPPARSSCASAWLAAPLRQRPPPALVSAC